MIGRYTGWPLPSAARLLEIVRAALDGNMVNITRKEIVGMALAAGFVRTHGIERVPGPPAEAIPESLVRQFEAVDALAEVVRQQFKSGKSGA